MRTRPAFLTTLAVVAAACSTAGAPSTTGAPITTTATTATVTSVSGTSIAQGSTTSTVPSSTTVSVEASPSAAPLPAEPLIVANEGGVFRFGDAGYVTQLIEGPVVLAIDDTSGGIMFQLRRGRFDPGEGSSIVWWVRPGSGTAESLLVPSQPDHVLSLHDAVVRDGKLTVLYTRGEGDNIENMADTLRRYDVASHTVTELGGVGGWEAGSDPVSIGGDVIAMTWYAEILNGFAFWDLDGNDAPFPADPFGGDFCEDRQCQWAVEMAPDGATFAYFQQVEDGQGFLVNTDLVVVETGSGAEVARVHIRGEQEGWFAQSIDLHGTMAVINRESLQGDGYLKPWVVEFGGSAPTVFEVPIAGLARVLRAPLTIDAPVTP